MCRQADIIIAAAGQAQLVRGSWVKPGAAVIDVGTNPIDDKTKVGEGTGGEGRQASGSVLAAV